MVTKRAALISGTRYRIRSDTSRQEFEDALRGLPELVEHRRSRPLDSARSRTLDVTIDGPAIEIRMLSVTDHIERGSPFRMRVRLVGLLVETGSVVCSGRLSTRRDAEVTLTNRVLPLVVAIGLTAFFVMGPISTIAAFFPLAAATLAGCACVGAWVAMLNVRRARAVEVARLLVVIGEATHGVVELESRRLHGLGRLVEPIMLDVPGPLIAQAMDTLARRHNSEPTREGG